MGPDCSYVDVVKANLNLSEEATSKSINNNIDGDRCDVCPSKESNTVTPPKSPVQEEAKTAPVSPVPPKEGDAVKGISKDGEPLSTRWHLLSLQNLEKMEKEREKTCVFPFYLPKHLCGKLIGRNGWSRREIREATDVDVQVLKEVCFYNGEELQLVHLFGPEKGMDRAIQMVRSKFPVRRYPQVRLDIARQPIQPRQVHLPQTRLLVQISCVVNPGLIYVRQPEHSSYCSYDSFQREMTAHYLENATPEIREPLPGDIYVALGQPCQRVLVVDVLSEEEVCVRNLDFGGIFPIGIDCLRPIREEFLKTPFQANECAMAGICENGPGWSTKAYNYLLSWVHQFICGVVSYNGQIPSIQLYRKLPTGEVVCINEEMAMMSDIENAAVVPQETPLEMSSQEEADGSEAVQEAEDCPLATTQEAEADTVTSGVEQISLTGEAPEETPEGDATTPVREATETTPEDALSQTDSSVATATESSKV